MERKQKNYRFRSGLEKRFADVLTDMDIDVVFEEDKFKYVVEHTYTPDFKIRDRIFVETKGIFHASDRNKALMVRKQNPGIEFIFVFQDPYMKINRTSKTTYKSWCEKNGFLWAEPHLHSFRRALQQAYRKIWDDDPREYA